METQSMEDFMLNNSSVQTIIYLQGEWLLFPNTTHIRPAPVVHTHTFYMHSRFTLYSDVFIFWSLPRSRENVEEILMLFPRNKFNTGFFFDVHQDRSDPGHLDFILENKHKLMNTLMSWTAYIQHGQSMTSTVKQCTITVFNPLYDE